MTRLSVLAAVLSVVSLVGFAGGAAAGAFAGGALTERGESRLGESVTGRVVDSRSQVASMPSRPRSVSASYWSREFKRRWLQERRTARARATTIRRLRAGLRARLAFPSGLERAFFCVHRFEGAWTSNTGNGYFGGLQMDAQFERTYGAPFLRAWGHANVWPVSVQLAVGMAAYLSGRGFGPWPTTRRMCGL